MSTYTEEITTTRNSSLNIRLAAACRPTEPRIQRPSGLKLPATVPSLARVEWEHMQRVISDCGGNLSQAARLLGIHRRSLQRKLAKYPPAR
jgi:ActR/RegA family two-component response regulator